MRQPSLRFWRRRPAPSHFSIPPDDWSHWLEEHQDPSWQPSPVLPALSPAVSITICGGTLDTWEVHLWLERLPIQGFDATVDRCLYLDRHNLRVNVGRAVGEAGGLQRIALNVELPPPERALHWFLHLSAQQVIFDPDHGRVNLMRALGLDAYCLDPASPGSGWLKLAADDESLWGSWLGLPAPFPCACLALGVGGEAWEHALADWEREGGNPVVGYLPGLPALAEGGCEAARLLAAWLLACDARADNLVALQAESFAGSPALHCLRGRPLLLRQAPITPGELMVELHDEPRATAVDRPGPPVEVLFACDSGGLKEAAVLISLYNYSHQVESALESVAVQTLAALELVVVDDASTDHSADTAHAWLARNAGRFAAVRLLRHQCNAGLAAARNTAFTVCSADWAFVLDADNILFPSAVEACLGQARQADPAVAVIHPWIEVSGDGRHGHDGRSLISRVSWQRQAFLHGNVLDAMALVRRSAWQAVGGYTHIEGGWEDFDFWCKLIEAGFHGVLCPRVLARYHTHADSMTATSTVSNWRPLSRCLQARHPWLDLPYAR